MLPSVIFCLQTSLSSTSTHPLPEQQEADDYSPVVKRARPALSPGRLDGGVGRCDPWARPPSPRLEHVESSSHKYVKYEHTNGDKSLLSQALEKRAGEERGGEEERDSGSEETGSERAGSASIDTVKSELNSRDCEPPATPLFPPGLEALYRQAGFPPFLGLGGPGPVSLPGSHLPPAMPGPSTTHVGLQSHAANPTSKSHAIPQHCQNLLYNFIANISSRQFIEAVQ